MMTNKAGEIGSIAPDFVLQDQNRTAVSLSDLRGKKVVLSFHPLAWTRVCTLQMQDLEKSKERLDEMGAVALGFSVDSVPCKKAWAKDIGVEATSLLADFWPHGGVAGAYGIFREADGFSERAVFILDGEGVIRFRKVYPIGELPDIEEILRAVESL
jgi:peroxiredoxin